ncbi:DNA polymerase II subunit B3-1 [Ziziphus jujuba]|uniref:DNA polymerase II subunit B3-1 n=1 Tax=Ziziphus jujuba TaxID=326968 RepID=A0A6P4AWZ7_ZIZJJ|nr:DNA polymerase II subunit B3-1 [Ziziphus jujuba]
MASSKKPVQEKKGNETKKKVTEGNSGKKGRNETNSSKTCNGTVSNSKIVPLQSSSSESQHKVEDGPEITKTPTSSSKSRKGKGQQKVKREREEEVAEKEDAKMNKFPMDRIKRIIRSEDSNLRISSEAIFLVNKATEKFLEKFCADSYACCVQDRKKSLGYKHLSSIVCKRRKYDFLSDFVPEKLKAEDALAVAKLTKSEAG